MEPSTRFVPAVSWALLIELAAGAAPARPEAPGHAAPATSFSRELRDTIGQLPPLQRSVLLADLDAGGQVAARDLALLFGTSPNSIYVSRSNGRRALYAALERSGWCVLAAPA